jgi:hypothetical protein
MSVHEDRRDAKSQRIPFEAIVEIGGEVDPGAAFEAQGVNLSATGMQLRTAYLPEIGQPLLCRFGSGAQEIAAEADVVWRREGARGGEFGIRFTNLDGASAAALWEMCGVHRGEPSAEAQAPNGEVDPGTRVRLHIDGLGSPMKARVRGATDGELLVGSNLEFLRVGRSLELEDVDRGGKRPAHIDRVDVEIDRASKVPQLVVTLRYDDVSQEQQLQGPPPMMMMSPPEPLSEEVSMEPSPPMPEATRSELHMNVAADSPMSEEMEAARKMRSKLSSAAADLMPRVAQMGSRAKTALGLLMSKAMDRSRAVSAGAAPRRMTSPPPTGALHASGKRVVREGEDDGYDAPGSERPKLGKKGMMVIGGAAAGLVTVVTAIALHKSPAPPPGATATDAMSAASVQPVAEAPGAAPASGALQANVPLFGPTTLSTTEPVSAAAAPPGAAPSGAMMMPTGAISAGSAPVEEVDDQKSDGEKDGKSSKEHSKVASFGHGKVSHPVFLRIKTDGKITELHGARSATGFTVTVPGRRAEGGAGLASRDSRIASVKVSHGSKGSDVTFQFKDGIPAYLVRAKGNDLQIALGRAESDDSKEESKSPKSESKHGATAKKHEKEHHHRSKGD